MLHYRRAFQDILTHRYLNLVTIITISLSILIASAFILFFVNANDIIGRWQEGIRIMAYLKPGVDDAALADLKQQIHKMPQIQMSKFIPKDEALADLQRKMTRQSSVFENLRENPLPDAFEIQVAPSAQNPTAIEALAAKIETFPAVAEAEYGQRWLGQFSNVINLFRLTGYTLAGLFFLAALFIVANTSRLILYSRREEIDVMRLVGATDGFIKVPFYIQGLIQGGLGGIAGLAVLLIAFMFISSNIGHGLASDISHIRFFSPLLSIGIIACSMGVGELGCYLALKQFLRS